MHTKDGINISTSAIVVMFLFWQLSASCECKLPSGGGDLGLRGRMEKRGRKTLAAKEMKIIASSRNDTADERLKGKNGVYGRREILRV